MCCKHTRRCAVALIVAFAHNALAHTARHGPRAAVGRRALAVAPAALAAPAALVAPASAALPSVVLPLTPVRGGLAASYVVDGEPFVGVVDTGSPFLLASRRAKDAGRGAATVIRRRERRVAAAPLR